MPSSTNIQTIPDELLDYERYDQRHPYELQIGHRVHLFPPDEPHASGVVTGLIQLATGPVLVFLNGASPEEGIAIPHEDYVTVISESDAAPPPRRPAAHYHAVAAAIEGHINALQHSAKLLADATLTTTEFFPHLADLAAPPEPEPEPEPDPDDRLPDPLTKPLLLPLPVEVEAVSRVEDVDTGDIHIVDSGDFAPPPPDLDDQDD
jgi:hypothetical protein